MNLITFSVIIFKNKTDLLGPLTLSEETIDRFLFILNFPLERGGRSLFCIGREEPFPTLNFSM